MWGFGRLEVLWGFGVCEGWFKGFEEGWSEKIKENKQGIAVSYFSPNLNLKKLKIKLKNKINKNNNLSIKTLNSFFPPIRR